MEKVLFKSGCFTTARILELIQHLCEKNIDNRMRCLIQQTGVYIDTDAGGTDLQVIDAGSGRITVKAGKGILDNYEFVEIESDTDPVAVTADGNTYYVLIQRNDNESEKGTIQVVNGSLTLNGTETHFEDEFVVGERIKMDSPGSYAANEVGLIISSITSDVQMAVDSTDVDGNAVSFTSESLLTYSNIGRYATGYPSGSDNENIRNHDQAEIVVALSKAAYSNYIELATVVNNAGVLTITDLRSASELEVKNNFDDDEKQIYVWKKVPLSDVLTEQSFTTGSGQLTLGNLDSGQSALPVFTNVRVNIGCAYQDRQVYKSTDETISGGNVSFKLTLSSGGVSGTPYFDIIIAQM